MKSLKAVAHLRNDKIVVVAGGKIRKTFRLNQQDQARAYVRGWNQLEK